MFESSRLMRSTKVLSLGLPRSGSLSMVAALIILGYQDVFHGGVIWNHPKKWEFFDRAADAHFSSLPTYTGKPFTRAEWDELYGPCEAITDLGSTHAESMIKTYPDAKVVLVRRPFEKWAKSYDEAILQCIYGPVPWFIATFVEPLIGSYHIRAMRKECMGFTGARSSAEAKDYKTLRRTYDRHHQVIKEMVPSEQLLEMELGDGWGPLCEFLGKPVPKEGFPNVNDRAGLRKGFRELYIKEFMIALFTVILPWAAGLGVIVGGVWVAVAKAPHDVRNWI